MTDEPKKIIRGFAALSPERRRELGRLGGLAAQQAENRHRWTPEEQRAAASKGGKAAAAKRRVVKEAQNPAPPPVSLSCPSDSQLLDMPEGWTNPHPEYPE